MKKIISSVAVLMFCVSVPFGSANAQTNEDLMIQLQFLLQQISELQALIEAQNGGSSIDVSGLDVFTYDSGDEFSVTYHNTEALDVDVYLDEEEGIEAMNWEFHDGEESAGSVTVTSEGGYEAILLAMTFIDLGAAFTDSDLIGDEIGFTIDTESGFQTGPNGFDTKTVVLKKSDAEIGIIMAFKEISGGGETGGLVITAQWGENVEAFTEDEDFSSSLAGSEPRREEVYFTDAAEAELFMDDLLTSIDYSASAFLDHIEPVTLDELIEEAAGNAVDEFDFSAETDADVSIINDLDLMQFFADIYYADNDDSYNGFCNSEWFDDMLEGVDYRCDDTGFKYAISAELSEGDYYCVDSTGLWTFNDRYHKSTQMSCDI